MGHRASWWFGVRMELGYYTAADSCQGKNYPGAVFYGEWVRGKGAERLKRILFAIQTGNIEQGEEGGGNQEELIQKNIPKGIKERSYNAQGDDAKNTHK